MKYTRLTKDQFEELHQEFINFLATQSITADEWEKIKTNTPEIAEEELDVFSDLVWEGVLNNAKYLEHVSPSQMHLFNLEDDFMHLITVKIIQKNIDITTDEGYQWLRENLMDDNVQFMQAKKEYSDDKNKDKFDLILKGAVITKGELFQYFDKLIN